ncbi:hypothetical protein D9757_010519 [Collybiopsis confluens]|uniref:Glutathione S-transferase n=1 Tax=Collybiopsis confluens TaxID=2823264 RepID=A0A8H5GNX4_9AGAR|nr:hypothetical protein D9757_010519 [Collybiopsis confluens]
MLSTFTRLRSRLLSTMSEKPFLLYTFWTNNGTKVSTLLEEMKTAYPSIDYDVEPINIAKNTQKEPWFLKINPNGQIPVLIDRLRNSTVIETGAILLYLQQHYDTENKFGWDPKASPKEYSESLQWILFAYSGIGPMQNQMQHFNTMPEKIPYAVKRYVDETKRLYNVLEIRLSQDRDWLVGPGRGTYSIADMNVLPWIYYSKYAGMESLDEWPNLKKWLERASSRPATATGLYVGRP